MGSLKRKQWVVNRKLQFEIIGIFLLSVFIAFILFTAATAGFYWFSGMAGDNLFKEYLTIHRQESEIRQVEQDGQIISQEVSTSRIIPGVKRWELIVPAILVNNLIILIVVLIIGLLFSHRIAGPLYRIQTDLNRVLDGESEVEIIVRRKDKMGELVCQLNELLKEIDTLRKGGV